jgi:uncharacterized protein (DUF2267 family)
MFSSAATARLSRLMEGVAMSHTTISAFTQAAEQAQHWVNELAADLDWDERRAYHLLRSALQTLRDFLGAEEMADLAAQLPVIIRGIYFEGWQANQGQAWERKKEDFVDRITNDFSQDKLDDPDAAIAAVFRLLDKHVSKGEVVQVRNSMKKALRRLWPGS